MSFWLSFDFGWDFIAAPDSGYLLATIVRKLEWHRNLRIFSHCSSVYVFWPSLHAFQVKLQTQISHHLQFSHRFSTDRETRFLRYMIQRQKNGELKLYGYERKLFQGTIKWYLYHFALNWSHADLVTIVGEPATPPDPLNPLSVNLYNSSEFAAVTWSEPVMISCLNVSLSIRKIHLTLNSVTYNVYMSKKQQLLMSICTKFDMYVCLRTDKL